MLLSNFKADEKGATAIEFALVSLALLSAILFVLTAALVLYLSLALDFAASKAARQVMTGAVQQNGTGQAAFKVNVVCPLLPQALACGSLVVNLQTVTEAAGPAGYYGFVNAGATQLLMPTMSDAASSFSPGVQQSYEYLQLVYPLTFIPSFFARLLGATTVNGRPALLVTATAAFRNEQY